MQLNPREIFTIARGLEDHTDNTVLYVRAFVRNARTDVLLETINLTNQGDNHRFSNTYQVPADPTGQGFYIIVTTSVYSDSGYTTKSTLYGDKYDEHLVMQRVNPNLGGLGGGGGGEMDYGKVRKIIQEELAKLTFPELPKFEQAQMPDLEPIKEALITLQSSIGGIKMPEMKVDFSGILERIDRLPAKAVSPQVIQDQLKPVLRAAEALTEMIDSKNETLEETCEKIGSLVSSMKKFFGPDVDRMNEAMEEIKEKLGNVQMVVLGPKGVKDDE